MDLSKAFDTTDHKHLIAKRNAYGFSGDSLKFILSYLNNRKRRTVIENSYNFWKEITAAVLQGFYLDPLLYNIFIMDLLVFSKTWDIANYIDDNNLYAIGDCFWVHYWEVFCWLNFFSALFHEKTVTFLPLSSQKSWYSFDWTQKDERLSRPWSHPSRFKHETSGLGIQHLNHSTITPSTLHDFKSKRTLLCVSREKFWIYWRFNLILIY